MKKIKLLITLSLFVTLNFAQKKDSITKPLDITGQIGFSYAKFQSNDNYFVNLGGPTVKYTHKKTTIGLSFYPSLRYEPKIEKLSPILGAGLQCSYKKVILLLPCYYLASNNVWLGTIGIGYKFK
jgi:hypothetical protein